MMLNIYTLECRKYLKWTDLDHENEYYTPLDYITEFYKMDYKNHLGFKIKNGQYCTSYKWSDLENAMKGIEC
jgi:hypothetical protein